MKKKKDLDQYKEETISGQIYRRKNIWTNIKKKKYLDRYKYLDQYDGSKVISAQGVQGGALAVPW